MQLNVCGNYLYDTLTVVSFAVGLALQALQFDGWISATNSLRERRKSYRRVDSPFGRALWSRETILQPATHNAAPRLLPQ